MKISASVSKASSDKDDEDEEEEEGNEEGGEGGGSRGRFLLEFFRLHVLDWRTLAALAVPAAFCLAFPVYWLVLAPRVWAGDPQLRRPQTWLIGYWAFAAAVWGVFLVVCFYRSR